MVKMMPSTIHPTIAHFVQPEKNLCPLMQPVAFVVLVNFKIKQKSLDPFAKRALPIHLSRTTVSRTWLMINLKIAMPVLMAPSQTQETNPVQHVLRENGCLRTTKVYLVVTTVPLENTRVLQESRNAKVVQLDGTNQKHNNHFVCHGEI
jgi:hypothetical protein